MQRDGRPPLYFATVAIEPNRWTRARRSTLNASAWIERAAAEGFSGVELWENHYAHADEEERRRLGERCGDLRMGCILNTYHPFDARPDDASPPGRGAAVQDLRVVEAILSAVRCRGVKFNVGSDTGDADLYRENVRRWMDSLEVAGVAEGLTVLCECHPGTIVETPEGADKFFAGERFSSVGYIIHPMALTDEQLTRWLATGRVRHAHIQSRSVPLRRLDGASRRLVDVVERVPDIGLAIEFCHTVGADGETAADSFAAAVDDMRFVASLFAERGAHGRP